LIGSAVACSAQCKHQAISQCKNGDGCCAPGCNHDNDDDCAGTTPIGGACAQPADCASGACLQPAATGWPGGYCSAGCTSDGDCANGSHCANKNAQTGTGVCWKNCSVQGDCRTHYNCYDADGDSVKECVAYGDGAGAIGAPCTLQSDCGGGNQGGCLVPSLGFKDGYCSSGCDAQNPCPAGSECLASNGECFKNCTGPADCRGNGYTCADSGTGTKICVNLSNGAGVVGDACGGLWDCSGDSFGVCITYENGYCSLLCDTGQATCPSGTTCVAGVVSGFSFCMKDCASDNTCRSGYQCLASGNAQTLECRQ
jgi:hypothetical protein